MSNNWELDASTRRYTPPTPASCLCGSTQFRKIEVDQYEVAGWICGRCGKTLTEPEPKMDFEKIGRKQALPFVIADLAMKALRLRIECGICPLCRVKAIEQTPHHPNCAYTGAERDIISLLPDTKQ
jgi:hypothetical protein